MRELRPTELRRQPPKGRERDPVRSSVMSLSFDGVFKRRVWGLKILVCIYF